MYAKWKKKNKIGLRDSLKRRTASSSAENLAIDDPSWKNKAIATLGSHDVRTRTITLSFIHSFNQPFNYSVIQLFIYSVYVVYVDKTLAPALNAVLSYCLPCVLWTLLCALWSDIRLIWIFVVALCIPTIYAYDCRFLGHGLRRLLGRFLS